jgi:hypothetical protein
VARLPGTALRGVAGTGCVLAAASLRLLRSAPGSRGRSVARSGLGREQLGSARGSSWARSARAAGRGRYVPGHRGEAGVARLAEALPRRLGPWELRAGG